MEDDGDTSRSQDSYESTTTEEGRRRGPSPDLERAEMRVAWASGKAWAHQMPMDVDTDLDMDAGTKDNVKKLGRPCKGVMGKVMARANVGEGKQTVYDIWFLMSVEQKRRRR